MGSERARRGLRGSEGCRRVDGRRAGGEAGPRAPSGENLPLRTQWVCPESEYWNRCPGRFHTLIVLSSDVDERLCPSAEKATERTAPICALRTVDSPLTVGSHRRTVRSLEPEATRSPDGDAATESTADLWPTKRKARSWRRKFQTMTHASFPPVTICFMFGLKQTDVIASLCPRKDRSRVGSAIWHELAREASTSNQRQKRSYLST